MLSFPRSPSFKKEVKVDVEDVDLESSVYESSSVEDGNDDNVSISSITPMMKRSKIMIFIVLLLGLGGGTAFIYFGIQGEMAASDESFQVRATQLAKDIGATVQEYETAARSVQDVCRRRETTRHQFRQFYEYLISGGLQVQAAQCLPNVTHDERATFEQDALAYYSEFYPDIVNYTGFKGWEYDNETDKYVLTPGRSEAPFYFPVDKCEPVLTNSAALGLDTYSHTFQKQEIDQAIATNQPILGGRLKLVQETEENAYTVIMRHPGVRVADIDKDNADGSNSNNNDSPINLDDEQVSRDIGNILIRIPSLLKRRGQEQKESIACYLYDITPEHASDGMTHVYLGAAEFDAQLANGTVVTEVRIPPNDTEYEDVLSSQQGTRLLRRPRIFQSNVTFASNAIWTLVITPIPGDDSFQPKVAEIVFGGAMILVSTIGLALFLWHNMKQVEKIHKAKSQAEAERNIIASLYPENVVERLLDDERAKQEASRETARNKGKIFDGAATSTVDSSRPGDNSHIHDAMHPIESVGGDGGVLSIFGSDPIAHHYEETTVVFMDMVGFTSWSKSREPARVFALLENVYNAFDLVAKRRRVFKVETVGDCYVAVTGVPDARRNHAAAMVLFANACLQKMTSLMNQLAPVLGEDTTALSLRVGMSSGPVTGGVLRGDKGRFQLFGDTMNTAARMESNGKPGMIHVSPTTAARLIAAGKDKWLTKREDKIVAKGIGEMDTYWVKVSSESMVSSGQDTHTSVGGGTEETEDIATTGWSGSMESTSSSQSGSSPIDKNSNRKRDNRSAPPKSTMEHMLTM